MIEGPPNPGDLRELIQAAQRIQTEVARVRDELSSRTAEGESGGGLVRCVVSGTGELLELSIDPMLPMLPPPSDLAQPNPDGAANRRMLEELVIGAVNVALGRAREIAKQEMAQVTGGLPMPPGMFGG